MTEADALPSLGVLTRTLIKSPVIRLIIPARIRHSSQNDVIFIRSDSVEIKEVVKEYDQAGRIRNAYLKDIIDKQDFDSSIRSARILGRPRLYDVDDMIKRENGPPWEQPLFDRPQLPPQILTLTLESSKVVFLCAFYDLSGSLRWLSSYRVLPDYAQSYSRQLGEYIAVDPRSRAMAVAANEDSFVLYALKSTDWLKDEVEARVGLQSANFDPVIDERFFQFDGVILKMEFLHPPKADVDEVILLVIIAKNEKTKLHCYVWDSSTGLRQATELGSGQRVPDDERLPLLLIPLTMSTAFILVFKRHITVYTGILTGPATPHKHILQHWEEPEEPGASRDLPLFTQWARAMRHHEHTSIQDNIYLCREDGVVRFLEINENFRGMIESGHNAGRLKVNVNTAFASLHLGAQSNDLLVVGGDLGDGGMWFFVPRRGEKLTAPIPNWTPTIDLTVTQVRQQPTGASNHPREGPVQKQMRIFACTGRGPTHGEITEIRYGIRGDIIDGLGPVGNAVTQIWALPDTLVDGILILISSPTDTTPLLIKSEGGELPDADSELQIISDASTITAGLTSDGCIIQVTATKIIVTSPIDRKRHLATSLEADSVTSASISISDTYGCILLLTLKTETGHYLSCTRVRTDSNEIALQQLGNIVELANEPSCSSLEEIQGKLCAFVSTLTGLLQVFSLSNGEGPGLRMSSEHRFEGDFSICDSIAMLASDDLHWLVCGLRNGVCQTFGLNSAGPVMLRELERFVLGRTSVVAKVDVNERTRAVLACEDVFCTLQYSFEQPDAARIHNILLTNNKRPGYKQNAIVAFTQATSWQINGNLGFGSGQWFCIEGDNFHLVSLHSGSRSNMIPRRLQLDGTPGRVVYSEKLDKLIILYTRIVIRRAPHHGQPGQRAIEPTFAFLDRDSELVRPDPTDPTNNTLLVISPDGQTQEANVLTAQGRKQGEKYLGMTEWFPTDGTNTYHMLIVFTKIDYEETRAPTGRLLFFSLSKNPNGQVGMTSKKITELKAPVFAVVPYGQSSLIYSCGDRICLHTLKLTPMPREWLPPVILNLQSRGVHLSVSGQSINVTTAAGSLSVLRVDDDNRSLTLQYSDENARDGIYHLDIPERGLAVISSKDGTIAGLQLPQRRRINNTMTTAFIAEFPGSITRLRRVLRPSWHQSESLNASRSNNESIIACSTDGTFYQIDILDGPSWQLLRLIIDMAERHPLVCPFRERVTGLIDARHSRHIEPTSTNKRVMQVDGDILTRVLERGAADLLRDMVQRKPDRGDTFVDFDSAAARERRFWELARAAGVDAPRFSAVVRWMRRMMVSVL